ncbi:hypothetical protein LTR17_006870 [Elasticomyces elasticus]|nr:hypothetical protein LTR17_006870 [Elasticomyces elasticus]
MQTLRATPALAGDIQDIQKSIQDGRLQLQSTKHKQLKAINQAADLFKTSTKLEKDLQTTEILAGHLRQKIKETKAAKEIEDQNAATYKARGTKEEFLVKSDESRFNILMDLQKKLPSIEHEGYEVVKKVKRSAGTAGLAAPPGPEAKKPAVASNPVRRAPNQVNDLKAVDVGKQQLIVKLKVDCKALQAIVNPKDGDTKSLPSLKTPVCPTAVKLQAPARITSTTPG